MTHEKPAFHGIDTAEFVVPFVVDGTVILVEYLLLVAPEPVGIRLKDSRRRTTRNSKTRTRFGGDTVSRSGRLFHGARRVEL